jgi:prepilin-type N-terminal cleavage/methylation domain-containing protein
MKQAYSTDTGFSLIELLATIVIGLILAMAAVPQLQQRFKQSQVDAYTSRLEAGINQMKASMISRQDACTIEFPLGAGTEAEIKPSALESLQIDTQGAGSNCPKPSSMGRSGGSNLTMNLTDLRLVNIKQTLRPNQANDIRLLISPTSISMTTIGGVTAPDASMSTSPLIIRIRSKSMHSEAKGFERCLKLEPMTGTLIRGTWLGTTFGQGSCKRNQ